MNIDREIAENVFGWEKRKYTDGFYYWFNKDSAWHPLAKMDWSPSTNIKHAVEVEAEMFKRGLVVTMVHLQDGKYYADFFHATENTTIRGTAYSDTLPEAICLAALEALK